MNGKLYCLFNPEYKGILKVGYTVYSNVLDRVKQITYQNAKEYAWQCLFYIETEDKSLETRVHHILDILGYKRFFKLGMEYFTITIDEAYYLFQAIAQMNQFHFQVCKIQLEGEELSSGLTLIEQITESYINPSVFLRTQFGGTASMPKGYWNLQSYK